MSCPHAAGTVALLLNKRPNLTYAQARAALVNTARRGTAGTQACGGVSDGTYPNHSFGAGIIDALAAWQAA